MCKRGCPIRIIWDWTCHGGRLKRFAKTTEAVAVASKCPLWDQLDLQRHWILQFRDPVSVRLRQACQTLIASTIHDYMEGKHPPKTCFRALSNITSTSHPQSPPWSSGHRRELYKTLRNCSAPEPWRHRYDRDLTCGRILAGHTHVLWRQRTITGIQSCQALQRLHPGTISPHIPLLPHVVTRSLRQERTEVLVKYAEDNQLTEEEQGLFQTTRDVMHEERRTPVGKQSGESITSLVANLQHRPISFSRTRRRFLRRPTPGQAHLGKG